MNEILKQIVKEQQQSFSIWRLVNLEDSFMVYTFDCEELLIEKWRIRDKKTGQVQEILVEFHPIHETITVYTHSHKMLIIKT